MDLGDYQNLAAETAVYPSLYDLFLNAARRAGISVNISPEETEALKKEMKNHYYPALGLAGEVGEFCNKLKKVMRDKGGEITPEFLEFAKGEIGNCLWYVAALSTELGLDLAQIAEANIDKLQSRKERGVLQGNGDNR